MLNDQEVLRRLEEVLIMDKPGLRETREEIGAPMERLRILFTSFR